MQSVSVQRACALIIALLSLAVLPASAAATSSQGEIDTAVGNAVQYLRERQVAASGEPRDPGGIVFEHGRFASDWVATALAAAGVDAATVSTEIPGTPPQPGPSLQDFLLAEYGGPASFWGGTPDWLPEEYERPTLVAYAAGLDPARLSADVNLPAQIAGSWNPATGGFGNPGPQGAYYAAFGILALAKTPAPTWALAPAVAFLRGAQEEDGSWGEELISAADVTATAAAALCEAGIPAYDPAVASALTYLNEHQVNASGAIEPGNAESSASTVSALNACGVDPQSPRWTTAAGKTAVDYLLALQVGAGPEAGGFSYEAGEAANLYSTAWALRAIAGGVFSAAPLSLRAAPTVAAGTPVHHLLAIELAPGNVRLCKVTAPAGAALTAVLAAANAGSIPAGCVTKLTITGDRVAALDGVSPANQDEAWLARLDRGPAAPAGEQPVGFGEVIALRLGVAAGGQGAVGPAGPAGTPGATGSAGAVGVRGARGPRGRPGRNAGISCRMQRRHSGKRLRCAVKHRAGASGAPQSSRMPRAARQVGDRSGLGVPQAARPAPSGRA